MNHLFSHGSVLFLALTSLSLAACGGGDDGEANGDGDMDNGAAVPMGGAANQAGDGDGDTGLGDGLGGAPAEAVPDLVVGPQGKPFEPEGITFNYQGENDGGLTVVAFTLHQSYGVFEEPTFHVALRNDGIDPICRVRFYPEFKDEDGIVLGEATGIGDVNAPMHLLGGEPEMCLSPGDVGMQEMDFFDPIDVSRVAHFDYGVTGAISPNAEPTDLATITRLESEPAFGDSLRFVGTLQNGHGSTIEWPSVEVFALDDLGRPIASFLAIDLVSVPSRGSWDFSTTAFDGEFANFVVYMTYRYPFDL